MQDDVATSIRNLLTKLAEEQRRSADLTDQLGRHLARSQPDLSVVSHELQAFIRESAGEYTRSLLDLRNDYNKARNQLSRQYIDRLANRLMRAAAGAGGSPTVSGQRAEIALTGPVGGQATAPFLIKNDLAQPEEITFIVSEFSDLTGQPPFRPPLRLDPPQLPLNPGEERVVTLYLQLLPELFVPERLYRAIITVHGRDLELLVHALAYRPTPTETPPTETPPTMSNDESLVTAPRQPRRRSAQPAVTRARGPRKQEGGADDAS
jgi:hypothetical protein